MGSFSTSLSGVEAASQNLAVISNNLANLDTTAFKDQQANFQDFFYQMLGTDGAGDPKQIGAGTVIGSVVSAFTQGTISNTGVPTDMAIQGGGFFIEQNGASTLYTRAGDFSQNPSGYLMTSDGGYVLGYPAVNGVISPSQTLAPLQISDGQISPPNATTNIELTMNLNASAAVATTGTVTFSEPVVVYDSLGASHTLTFNFSKTSANNWSYQITIPAADEGGTGQPVVINSGTLTFDGSGNLTSPTANVTGITVSTLADGAKSLNLTWQLLDPTTGNPVITQVAGQSTVSSSQQDGYASGSLQSFTVNTDGTIQGVFSNGKTLTLGQVALATFQNTQGLQLNGDNTYLATPSAGNPSIGAPNSGGRGTIIGESLEASNVDMTTELSDLVVAERDYQANARAISTADQMLNYVLTMQP
jgi:flagellar hook protein FlgE